MPTGDAHGVAPAHRSTKTVEDLSLRQTPLFFVSGLGASCGGGEDGVSHYRRSGTLRLTLEGVVQELTVFAMSGYRGGLFLPL